MKLKKAVQIFLFRSAPETASSNYIYFVKRGISESGEMNGTE